MKAKNTAVCARRGIVNVWVVLTAFVMIAFAGLASDTAYVYMCAHQLQNAADAAALAGARMVSTSPLAAMQKAINVAHSNKAAGAVVQLASNTGNAAGGDVVVGVYTENSGAFNPTTTNPNAVQVLARRTQNSPGGALALIFGPIFSVNSSDVSRAAIAMVRKQFKAGLIVLNPSSKSAFRINGNPLLQITGGGIQVNSSNSTAGDFVGNATISATEMRITGDYKTSGNVSLPGDIDTHVAAVPDPLASLAAPPKGPTFPSIKVNAGESITIDPGYYPGGITMSASNASLIMNSGNYTLGAPGLDITGGNLTANQVMIYVTKANGNNYGSIKLTGNGTINVTPPTSGPYAGISFFQDRTSPNSNKTEGMINGTSTLNLQGIIYMPSTKLNAGGNSQNFSNQIIVNEIDISGNGTMNINYDGRNPVNVNDVYLVK